MGVSLVSKRDSWASSDASDSDNSGSSTSTDPAYNKCYGTSKRASRSVQGWLERQAGLETSTVSELEGLAKDLVAKGVQLPANIREDLGKAIESRKELNGIHKRRGNCDKQHIFALRAFERVLSAFTPSPPPHQRPSPRQSLPSLRSGSSSSTLRFVDIKPEYMDEDPMWK